MARCEGRLLVLVPMLESYLDAKQGGDFIACDQQQLADEVGKGRLARQSVHIWIQVPLPKEHGCDLGDDERNDDLVEISAGHFGRRERDGTYGNEEEHNFENDKEEWEMYPAKPSHAGEEDDFDGDADEDEGEHHEDWLRVMLLLEFRH